VEEGSGGVLARLKMKMKEHPGLLEFLKNIRAWLAVPLKYPKLIINEFRHINRARNLLQGFSLLLVSGGGQLDDYWGGPWGHPYALVKWGLIARSAGVRYIFLGVGTCTLESGLSRRFIRWALALAKYRSYRDQTSKSLLKDISFTLCDPVCPDLAFSIEKRGVMPGSMASSSGKIVGVSPIAYLSGYNWPKKNLALFEAYIGNLVPFLAGLIRQGYQIVLFSTDGPDRHVVAEIVAALSNGAESELSGSVRQVRTDTLEKLWDLYGDVDFVVASRLHGILLAHLALKPVLAISYDRKVDTYMKDSHLSEYCLDIHGFSTDALMSAFETLVANRTIVESRLNEIGSENARLLKCQYDLILDGAV
jgi:polysaccharide pyruvyl transferase WcaK-like protein